MDVELRAKTMKADDLSTGETGIIRNVGSNVDGLVVMRYEGGLIAIATILKTNTRFIGSIWEAGRNCLYVEPANFKLVQI